MYIYRIDTILCVIPRRLSSFFVEREPLIDIPKICHYMCDLAKFDSITLLSKMIVRYRKLLRTKQTCE